MCQKKIQERNIRQSERSDKEGWGNWGKNKLDGSSGSEKILNWIEWIGQKCRGTTDQCTRRRPVSGESMAGWVLLWERKSTRLSRNTQEMGESAGSALLHRDARRACKQDCQENLTQEFSALTELPAPGTELEVTQQLSAVEWFSCSPLPCFLFQFLSTEPNSYISQFHEDDGALSKTRLCPWYLNLWHRFNLDGTEKHRFRRLLPRKASGVSTSALHRELQQAFNCHWGSGNPAGSGCLGNTLHPFLLGMCFIPAPLFYYRRMIGTATDHLSPKALKVGSSGWKEKLRQTSTESSARFSQVGKWNA